MGTNDGKSIARLVLFADSKGNNRATVASEIVLATSLDFSIVPTVALLQLLKPGL
jgi:hypothetical protein